MAKRVGMWNSDHNDNITHVHAAFPLQKSLVHFWILILKFEFLFEILNHIINNFVFVVVDFVSREREREREI